MIMSKEGRISEYFLFAMINSEEEREKICSRLRRLGGRQLGSDGSWCELHQLFKCEASAELEDVSHPVLTRIITGGRGVTR